MKRKSLKKRVERLEKLVGEGITCPDYDGTGEISLTEAIKAIVAKDNKRLILRRERKKVDIINRTI